MYVFFFLAAALTSAAHSSPQDSWASVAKASGWDVVASQLDEVMTASKKPKKRDKHLTEWGLQELKMPVGFMAGAELVFAEASPATSCHWIDNLGVVCRFTAVHHATLDLTELVETHLYRAVCKTTYSHADVLGSYVFPASETSTGWQINHVERCWALGGHEIRIVPVADNSLDGVGKGDDFLPPELVELSWREAEEIIRAKVPIFRFCQQSLPEDHPARSGQLEVRYAIDDDGSISDATIERATFTDPTLTDCVLERFKRIHIRPPMGGWTGGTFTLSFGK